MRALPLPAQLWFLLTAPVVLIDAVFVLTRAPTASLPHPLSDTPPFNFWVLYATYDRRYAPNEDAFVVVQSWLNLLEVAMGVCAVGFSWTGHTNHSVRLALTVSVMTVYKTILYLVMDSAEGGKYTSHNKPIDTVLMVLLPSAFWVLVPGLIAWHCLKRLGVVTAKTAPPATRKRKSR